MPGDQADILTFLADPATHGGAPVERIETHASIVFLAGDRALKLKRAVRYPYLDYSTPERRRAACQAELDVNRRFAPSLYLGLETVTSTGGTLSLGGGGKPVDTLVVMRRFDQACQFDHLADAGALTEPLMRDLADRLAEAHRSAPPAQAGGAAQMRAILDGIATTLAPPTFAQPAIDDWTARARAALDAAAATLDRRAAGGKVRACHGDLHLRNICLLDGEPTPFDAIEFDPALATIDILYDLAFLLMDLHARGLDAPGNALFNQYFDASDETDGLIALPLFLSMRAAIRAEVTEAARAQTHDDALAADAARYLDLARALLDPAPAPLIAIGGPSGTGKTTLARMLAPALGRAPGARILRTDTIRKRLAGVPATTRLPPERYTASAHAETYAALATAARATLEAGHAVIADATFLSETDRAALDPLPSTGLWLQANPDILVRRVAERTGDASDATPAIVRRQLANQPAPPPGWHVLDASAPPDELAEAARRAYRLRHARVEQRQAGERYPRAGLRGHRPL